MRRTDDHEMSISFHLINTSKVTSRKTKWRRFGLPCS